MGVACSIYAPSPEGRHKWSLEGQVEIDPPATCTCFCWKPHAEDLPQLLAVGTSNGIMVCPPRPLNPKLHIMTALTHPFFLIRSVFGVHMSVSFMLPGA